MPNTEQKTLTQEQRERAALDGDKLIMNVVDQGSGGVSIELIRFDDTEGVVYHVYHENNCTGYTLYKTMSCDQ